MPPSECTNGPPTEKVAGRSHEGTAENQRAALIASRVAIAAPTFWLIEKIFLCYR